MSISFQGSAERMHKAKSLAFSIGELTARESRRILELETGIPKTVPTAPHIPTKKQFEFLNLDCLEAFYGGAAGGGKTDALLMAALEFVDVPHYSALIVRRDFARLSLPGAIMDRAKEWLIPLGIAWNEQKKIFTFPSGAKLQFGYVDNPNDRFRYASAEFQFIGFDELTEFQLTSEDENNPYLFLFSRLRKTLDIDVPLRMRGASNPGNVGHRFVFQRFIDNPGTTDRVYIPARIEDNPALNRAEYEHSLSHLPPVTRARLMNGDWSVQEDSVIAADWLRYYTERGQNLEPLDKAGSLVFEVGLGLLRRFATVDTAGTSKQKAAEKRGKPPSWSVCGIWDYHAESNSLFLRFVWRRRVDWIGLKSGIIDVLEEWNVKRTYIENGHVGGALAVEVPAKYGPELVTTAIRGGTGQGAKLERAISTGFLSRLEKGLVYLPKYENTWRPNYEGELLSWTGQEEETADQIDISSYACRVTGGQKSGEVITLESEIGGRGGASWAMGGGKRRI